MVGQCKFCLIKKTCCITNLEGDDFACSNFKPSEMLLESEEHELISFINLQKYDTFRAILKEKIKHTEPGDHCIEITKISGDCLIIPVSDDYLDYGTEILEEFFDDAYCGDLEVDNSITFSYMRMTKEEYEKLFEESELE